MSGSERAPRVLVSGVLLGQPMGGVRRHNAELLPRIARMLRERGGRLTVLTGTTPPAMALDDVEIRSSRVPAAPPLARAAFEGRALRAALANGRFDLVHSAHLPAPRGLRSPFCLTLHDPRRALLAAGPLRRRFGARLLRSAFRRAAGVVAVSETMATLYRTRFQARRVAVVPNAADHLPRLPRAPDPADAFLLHVGHLEPRKNLGLLLEALALAPDLPRLVFAGAPKAEEDHRLVARARALGVEERIELCGPVDDDALARLYAGAACVVLPSRLEGFGIPALEALRAEVPLAVSSAGALPETAGPNVPCFSPDDPEAAARAIRTALASTGPELEARARRATAVTWDDAARRLVAFWSQLTGSRASNRMNAEVDAEVDTGT